MFNIGGGEVLVILVVALVVLGPAKLPGAARQIGQMMTELRRISAGFQNELRSALDETETPAPRENSTIRRTNCQRKAVPLYDFLSLMMSFS